MEKKNSLAGQMSLFDLVSEEDKKEFEIRMPDVEAVSYTHLPVSLHIQVPLNACLERIIMILIREKNSLWNSRYLKIHQPHSCLSLIHI